MVVRYEQHAPRWSVPGWLFAPQGRGRRAGGGAVAAAGFFLVGAWAWNQIMWVHEKRPAYEYVSRPTGIFSRVDVTKHSDGTQQLITYPLLWSSWRTVYSEQNGDLCVDRIRRENGAAVLLEYLLERDKDYDRNALAFHYGDGVLRQYGIR